MYPWIQWIHSGFAPASEDLEKSHLIQLLQVGFALPIKQVDDDAIIDRFEFETRFNSSYILEQIV